MCDLCEPDISAVDKKIFEPTCGNGNFLVEILRRKLTSIPKKLRKNPSLAKASITDFEAAHSLGGLKYLRYRYPAR